MSVTYLDNQAFSSKTVEWYTPAPYVEAARRVMGSIDLDPASCAEAQRWIKAERYYSLTERGEDGLALPWHGRVWLNPPFDKSAEFSRKLISEYESGHVEMAIALIKFLPTYRWFAPLKTYPMVVTNHRVSFWKAEGQPGESRYDNGIAFIFFGPKKLNGLFETHFQEFGETVTFRPGRVETCPACGEKFTPKNWGGSGKVYCGPACKQRAYRQRFTSSVTRP